MSDTDGAKQMLNLHEEVGCCKNVAEPYRTDQTPEWFFLLVSQEMRRLTASHATVADAVWAELRNRGIA
jgi:hypothetical protein